MVQGYYEEVTIEGVRRWNSRERLGRSCMKRPAKLPAGKLRHIARAVRAYVRRCEHFCLILIGGRRGARTPDLLVANEALSQLS
jgi:hypothetical protein